MSLLVGTPVQELDPAWSPDYRFLIYVAVSPETKNDLLYRERRKDGSMAEPVFFLKTRFNENTARFSPDGRYVAFMSDESGRNEIYVSDFPKRTNKWQISANGGNGPRWKHEKEIFYAEGSKLITVSVATRPTFSPGAPAALFEKRSVQSLQYDVSPGGKRFVVLDRPSGEPPLSIHVVHNWFEEFRVQQRGQAK
jgi:dipeptidyl aminopeptidase/acylaminoacyl peptidase